MSEGTSKKKGAESVTETMLVELINENPQLDDYRKVLAMAEEAPSRAAGSDTWLTRKDGQIIHVRPPKFERLSDFISGAAKDATESLQNSGILEHRAMATGSEEDIRAYVESLKETDEALARYWAAAAYYQSLCSDVSYARDTMTTELHDVSRERTIDAVRKRRSIYQTLDATQPLLPQAIDHVTELPALRTETENDFKIRETVGTRRSRVEAKLMDKKTKKITKPPGSPAKNRPAKPRAGKQ